MSRSPLEVLNPRHHRGPFRGAVLDFDGTLSLIRANWQGIMIPMMVEILVESGATDPRPALEVIVTEFVVRLTGQPTIVQMQALADEVGRRGGPANKAYDYLNQYHDRLLAEAHARIAAVQTGRASPDDHMVPGARRLVQELAARELLLVIASGTEHSHVVAETEVLQLTPFFGSRIHGPVNDDPKFAKQQVFEQLLAGHGWRGEELIIVGDGTAEIRAAKAIGALAIGVASDEVARDGRHNPLKYEHLVAAGADMIVADYRNLDELLRQVGL